MLSPNSGTLPDRDDLIRHAPAEPQRIGQALDWFKGSDAMTVKTILSAKGGDVLTIEPTAKSPPPRSFWPSAGSARWW